MQMCKTSKEIQALWKPTPGDFFIDADNNIKCWLNSAGESYRMKNGFKIKEEKTIIKIEKYYWLPRMNQLIETAQLKGKAYRDIAFDFYKWVKKAYDQNSHPANKLFSSIEQLWLAYIMEKKFASKWIEGIWHKNY